MKAMVTPVSEQTLTNLSVQVRKGAWSGLPAGVSSWRTQKTCPLESGHCRLEGRSTHPNPCLGGQRTRTEETALVFTFMSRLTFGVYGRFGTSSAEQGLDDTPSLRLQPIEHDLRNRAGAGLGPHHLRQLVEVFIAGDECQLMLHGKTRNPEVVGRNRTSRKPQLQE